MSHSKRNTSLAFFTSYERSLLKGDYGKQRTRLTRDSFKPLDACSLCLMRAREPVACPAGDLFCRECAVENLLSQHKEIKRMQAELDRRRGEEDEEQRREEEEVRGRSVREFELLQMGLEVVGSGGRSKRKRKEEVMVEGKVEEEEKKEEEEEEGEGDKEVKTKKRKFELDEDELLRLAREERTKARLLLNDEKTTSSTTKLPSFWLPSLTPSISPSLIPPKPPKLHPVCPASEKSHIHNYSLKTLTGVHFHEEQDERTKHGEAQRVCPACKKGLSNATKAMLAKPCGHVICKPCADKFVSAAEGEEGGVVVCFVCDEVLSGKGKKGKGKGKKGEKEGERGLVLIKCDGTGFSAGGGNVTTEKEGIAFQC
ncbi:hypothetical protein L873DRAFT_1834310 [Choiromyces venosus 120613-1]|uniref:RING-type domain-containing protein n=1 Tax=Choiromyces venosus 120613-1 TaxID=1336337 RepID=A0A3N4JVC3_9PEZI|nr:hypothetical protein L873DRAFT_1834310 [Choiromyces venosus 120613-1]